MKIMGMSLREMVSKCEITIVLLVVYMIFLMRNVSMFYLAWYIFTLGHHHHETHKREGSCILLPPPPHFCHFFVQLGGWALFFVGYVDIGEANARLRE